MAGSQVFEWNEKNVELLSFGFLRRNFPNIRVADIASILRTMVSTFNDDISFIYNKNDYNVYFNKWNNITCECISKGIHTIFFKPCLSKMIELVGNPVKSRFSPQVTPQVNQLVCRMKIKVKDPGCNKFKWFFMWFGCVF